jgi:hypothetical protein
MWPFRIEKDTVDFPNSGDLKIWQFTNNVHKMLLFAPFNILVR